MAQTFTAGLVDLDARTISHIGDALCVLPTEIVRDRPTVLLLLCEAGIVQHEAHDAVWEHLSAQPPPGRSETFWVVTVTKVSYT